MEPRKVTDRVFWVGAVDWNRRLFDSLIPLPDGTSYNAYLVRASEKTARKISRLWTGWLPPLQRSTRKTDLPERCGRRNTS